MSREEGSAYESKSLDRFSQKLQVIQKGSRRIPAGRRLNRLVLKSQQGDVVIACHAIGKLVKVIQKIV